MVNIQELINLMNFKKPTIISPYAYELEKTDSDIHSIKDFNTIISFIDKKHNFGRTLDIGETNHLSKKLSSYYKINIDQTNIDLDVGELTGEYDTIFCFEIIEHLFNPLHILLQINKVLDDNGTLFLSTPKRRPHFMWYKYHFHEFSNAELTNLFTRSEFQVIKKEYKMSGRPLVNYLKGFRPFLRLFLERKCLVKLSKII